MSTSGDTHCQLVVLALKEEEYVVSWVLAHVTDAWWHFCCMFLVAFSCHYFN